MVEAIIGGWVNYFAIAKAKSKMQELDEWVRTRLRMGIWKQRKRSPKEKMYLQKLRMTPGGPISKVMAANLLAVSHSGQY